MSLRPDIMALRTVIGTKNICCWTKRKCYTRITQYTQCLPGLTPTAWRLASAILLQFTVLFVFYIQIGKELRNELSRHFSMTPFAQRTNIVWATDKAKKEISGVGSFCWLSNTEV